MIWLGASMFNIHIKNKSYIIPIVLSFIILILVYPFVHYFLNENNYTSLHTFMEICGIFLSISIAIYSWFCYKYEATVVYLWTPFLFITIGILDYFHTFSFMNMPFFITANTEQKTIWLWMFARVIQSVSLFCLLVYSSKKKQITFKNRFYIFIPVFLLVFLVCYFIFQFESLLPILINANHTTTLLKRILEWLVIICQVMSIIFLFTPYFDRKQFNRHDLFTAFYFLSLGSFLLSGYKMSDHSQLIVAHIYKLIGFIYIFRAFYFNKITTTFIQKEEISNDLKEIDSLLRSFFDHTKEGIILTNKQGKIININIAFRKMFDLNGEEIQGKVVTEVLSQHKLKTHLLLHNILNGIPVHNYELRYKQNSGAYLFLQITLSPIYNDQGELEYISGIFRDITEQKQAQLLQEQTELELKNAVKLQQGIIFKYRKRNGQFIFTLWDGQLNNKLKIIPNEIINKELTSEFYKKLPGLLEHQKLAWSGEIISFELLYQNKILLYVTLNPVYQNNEIDSVIGSCIEITQLRQTENLLQKRDKLAVVGQMAAGVAHEIRNPLTSLKGFTQLLLQSNELSSINKDYLGIINSEIDRIELITNEFLMVAKPQAVILKKHSIINLIDQVIFFLQGEAMKSNVLIETVYNTHSLDITCDGNQIKQVLINLFKNSIEAMPNGGNLKVIVREKDDVYLQVNIVDTGKGIPKEVLPRLGEPFYTLKEKGTGLGLMVSYRILEANKGKISFESKENIGTRVELLLPKIIEE